MADGQRGGGRPSSPALACRRQRAAVSAVQGGAAVGARQRRPTRAAHSPTTPVPSFRRQPARRKASASIDPACGRNLYCRPCHPLCLRLPSDSCTWPLPPGLRRVASFAPLAAALPHAARPPCSPAADSPSVSAWGRWRCSASVAGSGPVCVCSPSEWRWPPVGTCSRRCAARRRRRWSPSAARRRLCQSQSQSQSRS